MKNCTKSIFVSIATVISLLTVIHGQNELLSLQNSLESRTQGIQVVDDHQIVISTYGIFPWNDSINIKVISKNQITQSINVGASLDRGYTYDSWSYANEQLIIKAIDKTCCDCSSDPYQIKYLWQGDSLQYASSTALPSGYSTFEINDSIHLFISSYFLSGFLKNIRTDKIVRPVWIEGFKQDSFISIEPYAIEDTLYFVLIGGYEYEPFKIIRSPDYKTSALEWGGLWSQNELNLKETSFPYFYDDIIVLENETAILFYTLDLTLKGYYPLRNPRLTKSAFNIFRWREYFNIETVCSHFIHDDGIDLIGYKDSTTYQVISLDNNGWTISKFEGHLEGSHLPVTCFRNSDGLQIISSKMDNSKPPNVWSQGQIGTFDFIWPLKDSLKFHHDIGVTSVNFLDEIYALSACRYHWRDSSFRSLTIPKIEVTVKNFGPEVVESFTLNYFKNIMPGCGPICNYFDGSSTRQFIPIRPQESVKISIGPLVLDTYPIADSIKVCFWTSSPNGQIDNNYLNDEGCSLSPINVQELKKGDLEVYPNPNSGEFVIHLNRYFYKTPEFRITNLEGRTIQEYSISSSGFSNNEYSISGLAPGVYHLEVVSIEQVYSSLIIVD